MGIEISLWICGLWSSGIQAMQKIAVLSTGVWKIKYGCTKKEMVLVCRSHSMMPIIVWTENFFS